MEKIRLHLGMTLLDIEMKNNVRLELAHLRDDSSLVIEKRVQIGYHGPSGGFDLPPTLMLWISQLAGRVVNVEWAPQLQAVHLDAVRALAVDTVQRIQGAGWQAQGSRRQVPSVPELEEQFAHRLPNTLFSRSLGDWQLDGSTLNLSLNELLTEGSDSSAPLGQRLFLLNLYISNRAIRAEQRKALIARRRAMGVGDNVALPLSAWIGPR